MIIYPFAEMITFSWSIRHFGLKIVLLWVTVSALLGIFLLKQHRLGIAWTLVTFLQSKPVSLYQLLWPIRYKMAGLLFIIPGFLSDIAALVLLLPFKGATLQQSSAYHTSSTSKSKTSPDNGSTIEGEFCEVKPPAHNNHPIH
ncbi:MAG: FxsA family protein [Neisseriales bacterium]|nr:MAG: FxsA family protein [Neisseriales bacterium]